MMDRTTYNVIWIELIASGMTYAIYLKRSIERVTYPLFVYGGLRTMLLDEYRYKLYQQHCTSDKLGPCEICGKFVADMYHQSKARRFTITEGDEHWAYVGDAFGHKECLISIRKQVKK